MDTTKTAEQIALEAKEKKERDEKAKELEGKGGDSMKEPEEKK